MMAGLDELRLTFFQECEDLLDRLGDGLRQLSGAGNSDEIETVHAVFRAVHSIKGGAAAFGLEALVDFAHRFETVLDGLRSDRLTVSSVLIDTLLRAGDVLADLVMAARDGGEHPRERAEKVTLELDALVEDSGGDASAEDFDFQPLGLSFEPVIIDENQKEPFERMPDDVHKIEFIPGENFYGRGHDPQGLIKALSKLWTTRVEADLSDICPLATFDAQKPRMRWILTVVGDCDPDEISAIFEFVDDCADIRISQAHRISNFEEQLVEAGPNLNLTFEKIDQTVQQAISSNHINTQFQAAENQSSFRSSPENIHPLSTPPTIRVNLDRVDRLINLIGELVIMEAMLSQVISTAGLQANTEAASGLDRIRQLAGEIQESVMAIRAQPLRPVFQRMERIIRDVTEATGKKARLITQGETTEVDKTVIERLVDPLTHMIRNSVDHGLEDEAVRKASGKPALGTITLSAAHRSGRVIIEVSDDGGGINRPRVRDIAEQKGLIPAGAMLSPAEIDNLLFLPGFSSKTEVSSISGRGVGLDVVRREIQALGGRVSIASVDGAGTTFSIALPLTLAVLEGMILEFGGETMVLPLSSIVETLSPSSATMHTLGSTGKVIANRGELIPVINLAEVFNLPVQVQDGQDGVLIVVEVETGSRAALLVDLIRDQRQVVIKSIEDNYGAVSGISAATILGDGRVALILDPEEVVRFTRSEPQTVLLQRKG
jgi:two-component system, chemotaxis family, sensor kinase CheA